jgi:hypothetical protein
MEQGVTGRQTERCREAKPPPGTAASLFPGQAREHRRQEREPVTHHNQVRERQPLGDADVEPDGTDIEQECSNYE